MKINTKHLYKDLLGLLHPGAPIYDGNGEEIGTVLTVGLHPDDSNFVVVTSEVTDPIAAESIKNGMIRDISMGYTIGAISK